MSEVMELQEQVDTNHEEYIFATARLTRDMRKAAKAMSDMEARFLVDAYYLLQKNRIQFANQVRAMDGSGEPHEFINFFSSEFALLELDAKKALDTYSASHPVGKWARSICGIGPVIAAGLVSNFDITKAPTVGHFWSFAGLNPDAVWKKKTKRPWNASLKTLCWKIGESFVKCQNRDSDIYGKVYIDRKQLEIKKNEALEYSEQAKLGLNRVYKETQAAKFYAEGKLPPGHINMRAKRYAVKLFIAHLHHAWYIHHYGTDPPKPYIIEHGGHVHFKEPPNLEIVR